MNLLASKRLGWVCRPTRLLSPIGATCPFTALFLVYIGFPSIPLFMAYVGFPSIPRQAPFPTFDC